MNTKLEGFWVPNDFGTRIEIHNNEFLMLWQNKPVLRTSFTVEEKDSGLVLHLAESGMRYAGDSKDYASVKECRWQEDKLYLTKHFPISGESSEVLQKTENSRYGNVDVVSEAMLPLLQGVWKTEGKFAYTLKIEGDVLRYRWGNGVWEKPVSIAVVKDKWKSGRCRVVNADPAQRMVGCFIELTYTDGTLTTYIPVCDAKAPQLVFRKK
ncbi:MAG: hypothetical protein Q4F00_10335 [bacterium]|nr:hypothetical protein [bacterium]